MELEKNNCNSNVNIFVQLSASIACRLLQVANLACSMSNNEEGVKMVRMAAAQIESLCPQVINAARVLAARPKSKVALENMDVFKVRAVNSCVFST